MADFVGAPVEATDAGPRVVSSSDFHANYVNHVTSLSPVKPVYGECMPR
jgi:hypothetical protein